MNQARRGKAASPRAAAIRVTPAMFHILLALSQRPLHGYAIMNEIRRMTAGEFAIGAGTLYRTVQKMILDALIVETPAPRNERQSDERRRYYALTAFGVDVAGSEAARLAKLVDLAERAKLISR